MLESPGWLADVSLLPEGELERKEQSEALQRSLKAVPFPFRTALVLVDVQGLSYSEAAAALGISPGTLKSRLVRGRLKLLQAWRQDTGHWMTNPIKLQRSKKNGSSTQFTKQTNNEE